MGFTPTSQRAEGRPSLTLDHLDYERGKSRPMIDKARLEAILIAEAINDGTTYTGTSWRTQSYSVKPSQKDNTRMVNDLLFDGLNSAFRDSELGRLLAR